MVGMTTHTHQTTSTQYVETHGIRFAPNTQIELTLNAPAVAGFGTRLATRRETPEAPRPHFQHAVFAVSRYSRPSTTMASPISSWRTFIKTFSRIQPTSRGLRHRSWRQRFDRDLRMQSDVEHIEDLGRPLQGNSEVSFRSSRDTLIRPMIRSGLSAEA
jgi:hypothetical protein